MITHCCQSVEGPLMNWKKADWKRACLWFQKDDGSKFTPDELKQAFLDELAQGHKVIKIGDCDNFDYTKGCLGHPDDWKPNVSDHRPPEPKANGGSMCRFVGRHLCNAPS